MENICILGQTVVGVHPSIVKLGAEDTCVKLMRSVWLQPSAFVSKLSMPQLLQLRSPYSTICDAVSDRMLC